MRLKAFTFLIIFLLQSCGFSPTYDGKNKSNLQIVVNEYIGDKYINNLIKNEIRKISNNNSENKYNLIINTKYEKLIISRDSKGSPDEYQLKVSSNIKIKKSKKEIKTININERQNLKNTSDLFEQKNYENVIKKNIANSIVRKINLQLLNQ